MLRSTLLSSVLAAAFLAAPSDARLVVGQPANGVASRRLQNAETDSFREESLPGPSPIEDDADSDSFSEEAVAVPASASTGADGDAGAIPSDPAECMEACPDELKNSGPGCADGMDFANACEAICAGKDAVAGACGSEEAAQADDPEACAAACPEEFKTSGPVCSNGTDYPDACAAACAGEENAEPGACGDGAPQPDATLDRSVEESPEEEEAATEEEAEESPEEAEATVEEEAAEDEEIAEDGEDETDVDDEADAPFLGAEFTANVETQAEDDVPVPASTTVDVDSNVSAEAPMGTEEVPDDDDECMSLSDVVEENEDLSIFVDVARSAGLRAPADGSAITLLIPTNAAFESLGQEILDMLAVNLPILREVLQGHVLTEAIEAAMITDGAVYENLNGRPIAAAVDGTDVAFAAFQGTMAKVVKADVLTCIGVVHIIDNLLLFNTTGGAAPAPGMAAGAPMAADDDMMAGTYGDADAGAYGSPGESTSDGGRPPRAPRAPRNDTPRPPRAPRAPRDDSPRAPRAPRGDTPRPPRGPRGDRGERGDTPRPPRAPRGDEPAPGGATTPETMPMDETPMAGPGGEDCEADCPEDFKTSGPVCSNGTDYPDACAAACAGEQSAEPGACASDASAVPDAGTVSGGAMPPSGAGMGPECMAECPEEFKMSGPVCSDGTDYPDACAAACDGQETAEPGACAPGASASPTTARGTPMRASPATMPGTPMRASPDSASCPCPCPNNTPAFPVCADGKDFESPCAALCAGYQPEYAGDCKTDGMMADPPAGAMPTMTADPPAGAVPTDMEDCMEACPEDLATSGRVCSNGTDYPNACAAVCAGEESAEPGKCAGGRPASRESASAPSPAAGAMPTDPEECMMECPKEYKNSGPVCSDGTDYPDACAAACAGEESAEPGKCAGGSPASREAGDADEPKSSGKANKSKKSKK